MVKLLDYLVFFSEVDKDKRYYGKDFHSRDKFETIIWMIREKYYD